MLLKCPTCKPHPQDSWNGDQIRVHNETKSTAPKIYRCTVCESTRPAKIAKK